MKLRLNQKLLLAYTAYSVAIGFALSCREIGAIQGWQSMMTWLCAVWLLATPFAFYGFVKIGARACWVPAPIFIIGYALATYRGTAALYVHDDVPIVDILTGVHPLSATILATANTRFDEIMAPTMAIACVFQMLCAAEVFGVRTPLSVRKLGCGEHKQDDASAVGPTQ